MRILITREREQACEMAKLVRMKGWEPIIVPAIEFKPLWTKETGRILKRIGTFDWLIFTSANGVKFFKEAMLRAGVDWRSFKGKVCAIGEGTASSLKESGIIPDILPESYVAEGIIEIFKKKRIRGKKILIPRAEVAREILPESLKEMGAIVKVLPVYRTVPPRNLRKNLIEKIKDVDLVTFTSSSTVKNVMKYPEIREAMKHLPVAVIGPVTAQELRKHGIEPLLVPKKFTVSSLINEIEKRFLKENNK